MRLVGLLITLFLVAACHGDPGTDKCIYGDRFNTVSSVRVNVPANSAGATAWVNTGFTVTAGQYLTVQTEDDNVDICANNWISATVRLDPTTQEAKAWQGTGFKIPYGNTFEIDIDGWWKTNFNMPAPSGVPPLGGAWFDGDQIYARLAEPDLPIGIWNVKGPIDAVGADFTGDIAGIRYGETHLDSRIPFISYFSHVNSLTPRQTLTLAGDVTTIPPTPGKRIFNLFDTSPGFVFDTSTASPDEISIAWNGFDLTQMSLHPSPPADAPKELYIRFSHQGNHADNYAGNSQDASSQVIFKIRYLNNCPGRRGEFLHLAIGNDPNSPLELIDLDAVAATGGTFASNVVGTGTIWLKVIDNGAINWAKGVGFGDGDYSPASNTGSYNVNLTLDSSGFTDVINSMIDPVKELLQGDVDATTGLREGGLTRDVYESLTTDSGFIYYIRMLLVLAVIFFAFNYMLGLSNITQKELFEFVVKLMIVATLMTENNWTFFYENLFSVFIEGTEDLIEIVSGRFMEATVDSRGAVGGDAHALVVDPSGQTFTFDFLNATMQRYFSTDAAIRIEALMFSSILGFILAILIYVGIILFVIALLKAVILYILSVIMVSLLLFLAPLFISFLLFSWTRIMFNNWIKNLISYAIQPVLLFTVLTIFNIFIYSAFYTVLSFDVCYGCIFEIDFPVNELIFFNLVHDFDAACIFHGYRPWSIGRGMEPDSEFARTPVAIFLVFIFIIFCSALLKFLDWIVEVGVTITAGNIGTSLNRATSNVVGQGTSAIKTAGRVGTTFGKAGFAVADWGSERVLGERMSDRYMKTKRQALKMLGGRSGFNPLIDAKGESDGMGGKNYWKKSLMTSRELRELKTKQEMFGGLSKEAKREKYLDNIRKDLAYNAEKKEIRSDVKNRIKDAKKELRSEQKTAKTTKDLFAGNAEFKAREQKVSKARELELKRNLDETKIRANVDKRRDLRELREAKQGKGITNAERKRMLQNARRERQGKAPLPEKKSSNQIWRDTVIDAKRSQRDRNEARKVERRVYENNLKWAYKDKGNVKASVESADKAFMENKAAYKSKYRKRQDIMSEGRKKYYSQLGKEIATPVAATYKGGEAVVKGAYRGGKAVGTEAVKFVKNPVKYTADVAKGVGNSIGNAAKAVANVPVKAFNSLKKTVIKNNDRIVGKNIRRARNAAKEAQDFAKDPVKYGVEHSRALKAGKSAVKGARNLAGNVNRRLDKMEKNRKERIKKNDEAKEAKKFWDDAKKNSYTTRYDEKDKDKDKDKDDS
ncbi:MAG: type IV secretion system protein [Rickettsiales bacterium]|nr:type IV secretion system protein [Rickettsiales bacterium]